MTIRPAWVVISCPDCGARAGVKCIRDDTTKRGELGDAMRISHRARTLRLRALRKAYARARKRREIVDALHMPRMLDGRPVRIWGVQKEGDRLTAFVTGVGAVEVLAEVRIPASVHQNAPSELAVLRDALR